MNVNNYFFSHSVKLISFFIYILKIQDFLVFSYITIPFYYENSAHINSINSVSSAKEYFELMLNLSTYTNVNINNKIIKFHLTFDRFASFMSEKNYNETCKNPENIEQNLYSLSYIGITFANYQTNNFHFIVNETKDLEFNYTLFVVKKMKEASDYERSNYCYATEENEIGFNLIKGRKYHPVYVEGYEPYLDPDFFYLKEKENNSFYPRNIRKLDTKYIIKNGGYNVEENTNLINQLKSKDIITSYAFRINFDKNNDLNGSLIIGGYPHELDPKHFQEKYFIYDTVKIDYSLYYYNYIFKDIAYGEQKLEWAKNAEFNLEFPFILSNWNYLKYLDEQFFKNEKYNKSCFQDKVGEYFVKYCSKDVIENFQNLYFYLDKQYLKENQTNYIEFSYKDLFIKSSFDEEIYLFQMIFADNSYRWILGRPLFKKYTTVFDQDKKIFGFYTETNEYNTDNNNNNRDNNKNYILKDWLYLIIILAAVFFTFCIILVIVLCKRYPFGKRKIKANELDDDYEYCSDKDKNQNALFIND